MTLRSLLIHECTIQRATFARDSHGEEQPTWSDLHTALECRLMISTLSGAERLALPSESAQVLTKYKLILPAKTDVETKDRVSLVTFEDGTTEGAFDINAVLPRRDGRGQRLIALDLDVVD